MAVGGECDIVDDGVGGGIWDGKDGGACGPEERRGMEGGRKHRPFVADAIDVRRLHIGVAANPQFVEPQIVDQDDQKIRSALRRHVIPLCRTLVSAKKGRLTWWNLPCRWQDCACSTSAPSSPLRRRLSCWATGAPT